MVLIIMMLIMIIIIIRNIRVKIIKIRMKIIIIDNHKKVILMITLFLNLPSSSNIGSSNVNVHDNINNRKDDNT